MDVPNIRIVLLGTSGAGKSSLANTIFGEDKYKVNHFNDVETQVCQAETKSINGSSITVIDTPGFFVIDKPERLMRSEMLRCFTECAPGPHVFLIVLKLRKFTEQEKEIVDKICTYFSKDALEYATVVFTHGDQLFGGIKIEEFVDESEGLKDLVRKCGGRCHVVDNKYWKSRQDEYMNNEVQVKALLNTIEKMVEEKGGGYYTNATLRAIESEIVEEEANIRESSPDMSEKESRNQAKRKVFEKRAATPPTSWMIRFLRLALIGGVIAAVFAFVINTEFVMSKLQLWWGNNK